MLFLIAETFGMRRGCRVPRNRLKAGLRAFAVVCALLCFVLPEAFGCPYSVRDVGFVDLDPVPYRLYCFVRDNTPQKDDIASTFERISRVVLMDANVEAELVKQMLLCAGLIEGDASDTVAPDAPDFVQVCEITDFIDLQMFNTYQNTPAVEHKEALQTLLEKTNKRMKGDHRSDDEPLYEHLQEWVPMKMLFVH